MDYRRKLACRGLQVRVEQRNTNIITQRSQMHAARDPMHLCLIIFYYSILNETETRDRRGSFKKIIYF